MLEYNVRFFCVATEKLKKHVGSDHPSQNRKTALHSIWIRFTALRTVHLFHVNFKQCKYSCISVSFQWKIHLSVNTITEFLLCRLVSGFWILAVSILKVTNISDFSSRDLYYMCFYSPLRLRALTSGVTDFKAIYTVQIMHQALLISLYFPRSFSSSSLCFTQFIFYLKELWYHFGIQF